LLHLLLFPTRRSSDLADQSSLFKAFCKRTAARQAKSILVYCVASKLWKQGRKAVFSRDSPTVCLHAKSTDMGNSKVLVTGASGIDRKSTRLNSSHVKI